MPEYVYYVCNEFGDVISEYTDKETAMTEAFKYEGFSVSRKELLTEKTQYDTQS